LPSQLSALLSYGDGAGHKGLCVDKSSDFRDARSELIDLCDDVTGTRCNERCDVVTTDFGDGGSGLIDDCEDVTSPPSYPPSTLLSVLLSWGEFNDLCNDVSERGDGGPGLIDHCDKISLTLSAELSSSSWSTVEQLLYCGLNDLCGDMAEHGNGVITRSTTCGGVSV